MCVRSHACVTAKQNDRSPSLPPPPTPQPTGKPRLLVLTAVRRSHSRGFKGTLHIVKWGGDGGRGGGGGGGTPSVRRSFPLKHVVRLDAWRPGRPPPPRGSRWCSRSGRGRHPWRWRLWQRGRR